MSNIRPRWVMIYSCFGCYDGSGATRVLFCFLGCWNGDDAHFLFRKVSRFDTWHHLLHAAERGWSVHQYRPLEAILVSIAILSLLLSWFCWLWVGLTTWKATIFRGRVAVEENVRRTISWAWTWASSCRSNSAKIKIFWEAWSLKKKNCLVWEINTYDRSNGVAFWTASM